MAIYLLYQNLYTFSNYSSFFSISYPIILGTVFEWVVDTIPSIYHLFIHNNIFFNKLYMSISVTLFFVFAISYTLLLPRESHLFTSPFIKKHKEFGNILKHYNHPAWFLITLIYCALSLLIVYLLSHHPSLISLSRFGLFCLILFPSIFLAALPTFGMMYVLGTFFRPNISKVIPINLRIIIVLLSLIKTIQHVTDINELSGIKRDAIVKKISQIANLIGNNHIKSEQIDGVTVWAKKRLKCAASNFLTLASWVYFPDKNSLDNLKYELICYLNIFLSGEFEQLPRKKVLENYDIKEINISQSTLSLFVKSLPLMLYAALPPIIYHLAIYFFELEPSKSIQSAILFLYLIWLIGGIISSIEKFSPDTRDFLINILQTLFHKKS